MPVVTAVFVAAHASDPAEAERIESVMHEACRAAQAEGISDPAVIKQRMLAARDALLAR